MPTIKHFETILFLRSAVDSLKIFIATDFRLIPGVAMDIPVPVASLNLATPGCSVEES